MFNLIRSIFSSKTQSKKENITLLEKILISGNIPNLSSYFTKENQSFKKDCKAAYEKILSLTNKVFFTNAEREYGIKYADFLKSLKLFTKTGRLRYGEIEIFIEEIKCLRKEETVEKLLDKRRKDTYKTLILAVYFLTSGNYSNSQIVNEFDSLMRELDKNKTNEDKFDKLMLINFVKISSVVSKSRGLGEYYSIIYNLP